MKIKVTKRWFANRAAEEAGLEIGAGVPGDLLDGSVRGYWMCGFHEPPNEHWIQTPQTGGIKQYAACGIVCTGGITEKPNDHEKCPECSRVYSANAECSDPKGSAARPGSE